MLRFGIISELGEGENTGFARVAFDEADLVSGWLPLPSTNTKSTKHWVSVEVNSQVVCLMDEFCEQGSIILVLWSEMDTPPQWANKDTYGVQFSDGTEIFYNAADHTLSVNAPDAELNFTCKKLNITGEVNITGDTNMTGDLVVTKEVTASTQKIKLTNHQHPTPSGVSGLPVTN